MDFENTKENIKPLATGRNVELLQASLCQDAAQELLTQRTQFESDIHNYQGDDPLDLWYTYICWIEQSYPAEGSGSRLQHVVQKCLALFENDERYKQDSRFIKLFIKFMETQKDKVECYQQLYNRGIGTMVADFYLAWAYTYDLTGNFRRADEIFRLGIRCRAQPLDELNEAHVHFNYTVGQRLMYSSGNEARAVAEELNERRFALQSLRGRKNKNNVETVGSVRTGAAIRQEAIQSNTCSATRTHNASRQPEVFKDENCDISNLPSTSHQPPVNEESPDSVACASTLSSIIDAARYKENLREPGPWQMAHQKSKKHGKLFSESGSNELAFKIHVDENALPPITNYENNINKPFKFPSNFVEKNRPQTKWKTAVAMEEDANADCIPQYHKPMAYPQPDEEYSIEEIRAYHILKRINPKHAFVLRYDQLWLSGNNEIPPFRRYPQFVKRSKPQATGEWEKYYNPNPANHTYNHLYNASEQKEYQVEELLAKRWYEKRNVTVHETFDMEETVCPAGNNQQSASRKSCLPTTSRLSQYRNSLCPGKVTQSHKSPIDHKDDVDQDDGKMELKADIQTDKVPIVQIYEDAVKSEEKPSSSGNDDNFLVPNNPLKTNKIEIYEDSSAAPKPSSNVAAVATGGIFDADETCSTQVFNHLLKSQPMSTPKANPKVAPTRQFGTILKEVIVVDKEMLSPVNDELPDENSPIANINSNSPLIRKQLSTILETSEHGTQGSTGTTVGATKSTIVPTSPSSQTTTSLLATATATTTNEQTPAPIRLLSKVDSLATNAKPDNLHNDIENLTRLDVWEPNAPSIPFIKSLRFQEDKTETVPKSIVIFQDDKTETMPRFPKTDLSMQQLSANVSKLMLPPSELPHLTQLQKDEDELCDFFGKTPPGKGFGSPSPLVNPKRHCEQRTPDFLIKSFKTPMERGVKNSRIFHDNSISIAATQAGVEKHNADNSVMGDFSFVPETQQIIEKQPSEMQCRFEIFLDETVPAANATTATATTTTATTTTATTTAATTTAATTTTITATTAPDTVATTIPKCDSRMLDISIPETQQEPMASSISSQNHNSKTSTEKPSTDVQLSASFMKDFSKITSFTENMPDALSSSGAIPKRSLAKETYFELNTATEMFATNNSMIRNSTLLPTAKPPMANISVVVQAPPTVEENSEISIYYQKTPLSPKQSHHSWRDNDATSSPPSAQFIHPNPIDDQVLINATIADQDVNPFNVDLINSLLDSIGFSLYIEKLPDCELVGHVKRLQPQGKVSIREQNFEVMKLIGKGAYGSVYSGKHCESGKKVALKQERPPNCWEYYICLEVQSRLKSEQMVSAYMQIDYALVGNNSSIFISDYSDYGSLINVCNKIKKHSAKNVDEYVVMNLSCQLLDIVDHLHAIGIIHADLKPDNFLLMKPLSKDPNDISLQLIDFGVSIDTQRFAPNQTFNYVHNDDTFKCIEMRTSRPWTYQLDLYGLCGIIHVLLFGNYMQVMQRQPSRFWLPKTQVPRYFNKQLWEDIFRTLLNIRDCRTMPNLQQLRTTLKSEMVEKEKYVVESINKFNELLKR